MTVMGILTSADSLHQYKVLRNWKVSLINNELQGFYLYNSKDHRKKDTLAGVALCLLRFWPDLLLPFLCVTEADKRSSSGTEFNCWGLCALW